MPLTKVQTIGIETGISLTGVTTAVSIGATNINVTGVITSTSAVVGTAVTINASGINATAAGIAITATNIGIGSGGINGGPISGDRNKIINGAMMIDQRNAGVSTTPAGTASYTYILDRWAYNASQTLKTSIQQVGFGTTGVIGLSSTARLRVASAVTPGVADYFIFVQKIEGNNIADLGWGSSNAQPVTVSFFVNSSVTGTYAISARNAAINRSYVDTYTINSANTWEYKTIVIPGDTAGTWQIGNDTGMELTFDLGSGSNFNSTAGTWAAGNFVTTSGAVKWISTAGAQFHLTGVQLERGRQATPFEMRSYGQELALCQRYYQVLIPNGVGGPEICMGIFYSATDFRGAVHLKQTMRTVPALNQVSGTNYFRAYWSSSSTPFNVLTLDGSSTTNYVELAATTATGTSGAGALLRADNNATFVALSSEL